MLPLSLDLANIPPRLGSLPVKGKTSYADPLIFVNNEIIACCVIEVVRLSMCDLSNCGRAFDGDPIAKVILSIL